MSYDIDRPLTQHQVRWLLDELCIELGFCLPPTDIERLLVSHPRNARDFADEVFRAEGLDPEMCETRLWRQVHDKIQTHFDRAS